MIVKRYLGILAVLVVIFSVGIQAVSFLEANMTAKSIDGNFILENFKGTDADVDGGGGDPVPGPGIPL